MRSGKPKRFVAPELSVSNLELCQARASSMKVYAHCQQHQEACWVRIKWWMKPAHRSKLKFQNSIWSPPAPFTNFAKSLDFFPFESERAVRAKLPSFFRARATESLLAFQP